MGKLLSVFALSRRLFAYLLERFLCIVCIVFCSRSLHSPDPSIFARWSGATRLSFESIIVIALQQDSKRAEAALSCQVSGNFNYGSRLGLFWFCAHFSLCMFRFCFRFRSALFGLPLKVLRQALRWIAAGSFALRADPRRFCWRMLKVARLWSTTTAI